MICSNTECSKEFNAQKYCSDDCCRIATNKRIMEKYYEKRAIKKGAKRECKFCQSQLSRYNQDKVCAACLKNVEVKAKNFIMGIINDIG
jgi:hypothetical protein